MRKGWEYKKLGEVCDVYQPKTLSTDMLSKDGEYPVYGANGIIGYYHQYNHEDKEVLLTCRGATCGNINVSKPYSWINGNAMVIHRKSEFIDFDFLKYTMLSLDYSLIITGAAQPQITRQKLAPTKIAIPPKSTQLAIVTELDKINELIRLKKEQLKDFDNLAQSLFYEMFGDPVENEKGWEVKKLGDVSIYPNKRIQVSELNPQDYVGVENLQKNRAGIVFSDKIPNTDSAIAFSPNDILIGNIRPYLKKIWLADKSGGASGDVVIIRICTNDLQPMYLYKVLASDQFFEYDNTYTKGAKMPRGDKNAIAKFIVPLPPLSLQRLFAQRIEQIEREKSEVQKSIQDLETLLASRMQYWFE